MNNKKSLFLSVIGILGLIAITIGVTYAFFSYAKEGTTDNTVTTGTITFLYTEVSGVGKGISLIDSYPISDSQGKNLTGEGKVFDFKVTSTNNMNASIPYEITARKKDGSTLDEEAVRIYLTKVSGTSEEEILLDNYSNLEQTSKISKEKQIEKTLYTSKVPASVGDYEQAYRLRMWIDESTDFSPVEDNSGNITYPYNNKTFTITVNVYANAKVVTEEEIENASKAEIRSISIDGTQFTKVENEDYDYEISLPEGTTQTTLDIETTNEYATVKVEKIDNIAYSSNVKRLSTKKTVDLNFGNNYFKVTVTSEDGKVKEEFKIKINVCVMYPRYNIGDAVTTIDGSKWHVLELSDEFKSDVVLLSDYNLNSDGSYNTTCGININGVENCSNMKFDPNNTIIYDENDSNNVGYFIKNTYAPLVLSVLQNTINITLPTVVQIQNVDGINVDISSNELYKLKSEWLLTTSFYTKTYNTGYSNYVWAISSLSNDRDIRTAQPINPSGRYGVRPVITTPKSNLLTE